MSLRIRRGSDAERLGVRFDQGEIVWVNSSNTSRPAYKLYVGDGVTLGGRDIVETSAGTNLVYNTNTGKLDVSGLTTDDIAAGTNNQFFTKELAQNAVAELFANGTMTGIEFVYDDLQNKMDVTVTGGGGGTSGIEALVEDLNPALGGDLNLNAFDITGTGDISITGNIVASGTLAVTNGLGANLSLSGYNITGSGDIDINGAIVISSTISSAGLGSDLSLNNFDIEGQGNIDIGGTFSAAGGLGASLDLNESNIIGTGSVDIIGNILATGTLNVGTGLGSNLDLNESNIIGIGNIDITGALSVSTSANVGTTITAGSILLTQTLTESGILIETNNGGSADIDLLTIRSYHDESDDTSGAFFARSRGTYAAPAAVNNGDLLFKIVYAGRTTNDEYGVSSALVAEADGIIDDGILPGKFSIWTANALGILAPKLAVGPDGMQTITAPDLVAGVNPGDVDTSTISSWMKVNFNGVDYAVPMYAIRT
jgi:hypothetical protein